MAAPIVAACQMPVADLDVETNLERIRRRVLDLPPAVDVAAFPEHALTGFVPDERLHEHAIAREDGTLDHVRALAADADRAIVVGFVERADGTYYNATAYVGPESTAVYRKRHLWGAERTLLSPGTRRVVVETPVGRAGLLTCYDLNFVEESAALTREDVDALFVAGASEGARRELATAASRPRARRRPVGRRRRTYRPAGRRGRTGGGSCVVSPDGSVAAELDRESDDCVRTLDSATLAEHRSTVFPDSDPSNQ